MKVKTNFTIYLFNIQGNRRVRNTSSRATQGVLKEPRQCTRSPKTNVGLQIGSETLEEIRKV